MDCETIQDREFDGSCTRTAEYEVEYLGGDTVHRYCYECLDSIVILPMFGQVTIRTIQAGR